MDSSIHWLNPLPLVTSPFVHPRYPRPHSFYLFLSPPILQPPPTPHFCATHIFTPIIHSQPSNIHNNYSNHMGGGLMAAKLCDSCKSASATVFCRSDTAFLCTSCDANIHSANHLASRHARVWVCEVCEQSPATVTCKADAAHLCPTCDRDIHSANPLARRHDRVPLVPFFDHPEKDSASFKPDTAAAAAAAAKSAAISKLFGDEYYSDADEAEAASWLLPNPKGVEEEHKSIDYLFGGGVGGGDKGDDIDPYLDLDFAAEQKADPNADGVVPDQDQKEVHVQQQQSSMYSLSSYNHTFDNGGGGYESGLKHYSLSSYAAAAPQPSLSHSVSSSSMEFGVVPDANAMADVASTGGVMERQQMKILGMDREARVLRYREKRKNRKFEKTIRYASRKAYAETRPRIKGRFAKRTDVEADVSTACVEGLFASDPGYGVVPSF